MLDTFRNAWRIEDLRKKILYTLFMLLIYRLGSVIPTPGVNASYISEAIGSIGLLSMLDFINGSNFSNFTIFAMGIQPYITSSIIMQLLAVAIPSLERMQKEGEAGRKKIAQITRYVTVGLGFIQAIGIIVGLGSDAVASTSFWNYLVIGLSLAAGTSLTMWIGERITEKGIGNGISLLIFVGIVASLPGEVISFVNNAIATPTLWWWLPVIVVAIVAMFAAIVYVDGAQRKIPVQYAKKLVGRRMYGGQNTFIPLKVNANGVMPLIFASSILQFPALIISFWPESGFYTWFNKWFSMTSPVYMVVFALLIVGFAYFYSSITFNPKEIAENLRNNGGLIPGIRSGFATAEYLNKSCKRITFFGAIFLAILAVIPSIVIVLSGSSSPFTATGILIAVSVALETSQALEAQMLMRHYKGFIQ